MPESMTNAHNDSQDTSMKLIQKSVHVCQVQGTMYNIHAQCQLPKAEPFHLQMDPHNIESMIYTHDNTDSRKIILVYSLLMLRVIIRIYNVFLRQIQPTQ